MTYFHTSSMSPVTSDSPRLVRFLDLTSPFAASCTLTCTSSLTSVLPPDTSLAATFQRGGSGEFESLYTRELKCHGLKNILS